MGLRRLFRMHWLAMRFDLAERFEAEALAAADDLGLKGIRANILSARGALWAARGDQAGFDLLEESIRLFEELNMSTSQRSYNNLADAHHEPRRPRESDRGDGADERGGKRFASPDWLRWADSQRSGSCTTPAAGRRRCRWPIAMSPRRRPVERSHYLDGLWRWERGASSSLAAMTPARSKRARLGPNVPRSPATRRS